MATEDDRHSGRDKSVPTGGIRFPPRSAASVNDAQECLEKWVGLVIGVFYMNLSFIRFH